MSLGNGSIAGGDSVTISGANFTGATGVFFGTLAAASFAVAGDGSIVAVAPAQAVGTIDVTVVTLSGASATGPADQFTYRAPARSHDQRAEQLDRFHGRRFDHHHHRHELRRCHVGLVRGRAGSIIRRRVADVDYGDHRGPAGGDGRCRRDDHRRDDAGFRADQFTFTASAPIVTGLGTGSGFASGGESVTIFGVHLAAATGVLFGSVPASSVVINDDGTITAVAPAQAAGVVDVTVQSPSGNSAVHSADQFTYTPAGALPVVAGLSTSDGTIAGGELIIITGTNFTDVTGVSFGPCRPGGSVSIPRPRSSPSRRPRRPRPSMSS